MTASEIGTIDHIGILVSDLDAAVRQYVAVLGAVEVERAELPEQGVAVVALRSGGSIIELMCPTEPDTGVWRFLHSRGEGLHHVAYVVDSVDAALDELRGRGVELVDQVARAGLGGRKVAFVHPRSLHGVLTELVEPMEWTR